MIHVWRLSEAGERNLGLARTKDGLVLGRTALIERRDQSNPSTSMPLLTETFLN